jgi:hypothetical protein
MDVLAFGSQKSGQSYSQFKMRDLLNIAVLTMLAYLLKTILVSAIEDFQFDVSTAGSTLSFR